jgi:hypothetical protein
MAMFVLVDLLDFSLIEGKAQKKILGEIDP